jgi:hypothetical protein
MIKGINPSDHNVVSPTINTKLKETHTATTKKKIKITNPEIKRKEKSTKTNSKQHAEKTGMTKNN